MIHLERNKWGKGRVGCVAQIELKVKSHANARKLVQHIT